MYSGHDQLRALPKNPGLEHDTHLYSTLQIISFVVQELKISSPKETDQEIEVQWLRTVQPRQREKNN